MVRFIKQEAEEKANEIAVSAEEVRMKSLRAFLTYWNNPWMQCAYTYVNL